MHVNSQNHRKTCHNNQIPLFFPKKTESPHSQTDILCIFGIVIWGKEHTPSPISHIYTQRNIHSSCITRIAYIPVHTSYLHRWGRGGVQSSYLICVGWRVNSRMHELRIIDNVCNLISIHYANTGSRFKKKKM